MVLLLFFTLTIGCEKNKKTIVQGKVINTGSQELIDSVLVVIRDGVDNTSGGFNFEIGETSSGNKNVAYTNSEGEFKVEISGEHQAFLSVSKEGYSFHKSDRENVMGALMSYPNGTNSGVLIEMKADASFEGFFKSTSPVNLNDTLIVYPLFYDNIDSYYSFRVFVGKQTSKYVFGSAIGDKYLRFKIEYQRNNGWNTKIDSVYIESFDTYTDTIYY